MSEHTLKLRPIQARDFGTLQSWSQDRVFCWAAEWTPELSYEAVDAFWSRLVNHPSDDFLRLGVDLGGQLVGYTDLAAIDDDLGTAELGLAIGPSLNWGRGLGLEAGRLMLAHGFEVLQLRHIWAEVHAPNRASLALMSKLGFVQEGVLRQHGRYRGQVVDLVRFGMLREEFGG